MVILLDTNVLLDYLETREPYFENSYRILLLCAEGGIKGYVAFHSIPNIFYIMRKTHDQKKRRELLIEICSVLTVVSASHEKVVDAINREDFSDFEDCLQMQSAKEIQADYIITRNANDYCCSDVPAITPEQFLEIMEKE